MELLERITVEPGKRGGRPCIRGIRITISDVLELLANGLTPDEVLKQMPDLELDDVRACLAYAARYIDHPRLVAAASA
ncbi:MAG TPA: DUF433 domain-containing protein [Tepidisphaeraceae bacterium]|nr:DUF433 domain-containing protein [Tepidisphaeraceae bacterium]